MRTLRLAVALLFTSIIVLATPSNCPISPGTDLNTLNGDGGCIQVDILFNSFNITTDPSSIVPAPTLSDVLLFGTGAAPNMDANFNTPGPGLGTTWSVPGDLTGGELNQTLTYTANLQNLNDFVALSIDGTGTTVTGNGLVILTETYCLGATTTVGCAAGSGGAVTAVFFNGALQSNSSPALFLPTSPLVAISEQIQMFNIPGSATALTNLDNDFQEFETPEPATLLLLGSALGAFGLIRRRARRG